MNRAGNQSSQQQDEGCGVVKVGKYREQSEQCHLTDLQDCIHMYLCKWD